METKLTTFEKLCKLDPANLLDTACHRLFNDISKHVLEKVNPVYDCSNHPRLDGQLKHGFNNFVISGDHKGDARPGILVGHLPAGENQLGLAWPHLRKQAAVEKNWARNRQSVSCPTRRPTERRGTATDWDQSEARAGCLWGGAWGKTLAKWDTTRQSTFIRLVLASQSFSMIKEMPLIPLQIPP